MIYQVIEYFNDFFGYDDLKKKHTKEFLEVEEYDCNLKIKSLDDWYSELTNLIKSYCNYWAMDEYKRNAYDLAYKDKKHSDFYTRLKSLNAKIGVYKQLFYGKLP